MRVLLGCALGLFLCCGLSAADDKVDAKKLIGKWEPKEKKEGASMVIEFAKDGKLTITVTGKGKEVKIDGTYKVDGNKLVTTLKVGDKEKTDASTVTKLTDSELTTKDEKGKEDTLLRVKAK